MSWSNFVSMSKTNTCTFITFCLRLYTNKIEFTIESEGSSTVLRIPLWLFYNIYIYIFKTIESKLYILVKWVGKYV